MAVDISGVIIVENVAPGGTETEHTFNANAKKVHLRASGTVTMTHTSGGNTMTVTTQGVHVFENPDFAGRTVYFDGTGTAQMVTELIQRN